MTRGGCCSTKAARLVSRDSVTRATGTATCHSSVRLSRSMLAPRLAAWAVNWAPARASPCSSRTVSPFKAVGVLGSADDMRAGLVAVSPPGLDPAASTL